MNKKSIFSILRYVLLPDIWPRIRALFGTGFSYIALFLAQAYAATNLLPANHPYLSSANIGRFGIGNVFAQAAKNLQWRWSNTDQILLFWGISIGLFLGFIQLVFFAGSLFIQPVFAALSVKELFSTQYPENDLAFMFLDMVFGVPDVFNSCISKGTTCEGIDGQNISENLMLEQLSFPYPIHHAFHTLMRIYNIGLLFIAVGITTYLITTIVLETAQTGTPFGKRFNKVWAPLRLIVAFALLMPLGIGLNAAQYIVLYAGKFGSGFATNAWVMFNETLTGEGYAQTYDYLDNFENNSTEEEDGAISFVAHPNPPEIMGLLQFLYTAKTCAALEKKIANERGFEDDEIQLVKPYLVRSPLSQQDHLEVSLSSIAEDEGETTYEDMLKFANGQSQVTLRFGTHGETVEHKRNKGHVIPTCGELVFKLSDPRPSARSEGNNTTEDDAEKYADPGIETMQRFYWYIALEFWFVTLEGDTMPGYPIDAYYGQKFPENIVELAFNPNPSDPAIIAPPTLYAKLMQDFYMTDIRAAMLDPKSKDLQSELKTDLGALAEQNKNMLGREDKEFLKKGWGAAGIWYNRIAEMNGAMTSSVLNMPIPTRYPQIMEVVARIRQQTDLNPKASDRFNPNFNSDTPLSLNGADDKKRAEILWNAYNYWQSSLKSSSAQTAQTNNILIDAINTLFGTQGLFDMRNNTNVHPLAQITGLGRSLVEGALRNLGNATIVATTGGLASTLQKFIGDMASIGTSFVVKTAMISMSIGVLLFYIVPFLPFIYFMFALGNLIKAMFEAMVGAPLWALAHLQIDGEGFIGKQSKDGYSLIFMIFIYPITTLFGFVASISVLAALVYALNQIWDIVVANVGGFDINTEAAIDGKIEGKEFTENKSMIRGTIDQFFFTVLYAIVVYMVALSSFKLIDQIPNSILRWMGESPKAFSDESDNPAEGVMTRLQTGVKQASSPMEKGMTSVFDKLSKSGQSVGSGQGSGPSPSPGPAAG